MKIRNLISCALFGLILFACSPSGENGKYYFYFGANNIYHESEVGGIGVAFIPPEVIFTGLIVPFVLKYIRSMQVMR